MGLNTELINYLFQSSKYIAVANCNLTIKEENNVRNKMGASIC